jgi:hypothetical protein
MAHPKAAKGCARKPPCCRRSTPSAGTPDFGCGLISRPPTSGAGMTPEKAVEIAMGPQHVRVDFEPELRSTMRANPAVVKGAPRSNVKAPPANAVKALLDSGETLVD